MKFDWDKKKNKLLKEMGRPNFDDFEAAYECGAIFFEGENKNHKGQGIFVAIINNYAHVIAYEDRGVHLRLATVYPSRKWQKKFKKESKE
jgi:uncharacterized DUF497 family protein